MVQEDILKIERQFIYLLLHHKPLVNDWIESSLEIKHFNNQYKTILTVIVDSYDKDVLLTRKSFRKFIEKFSLPIDQVQQDIRFSNCLSSVADKNDFPLLSSTILDNYLSEVSVSAVKRWSKNKKEKGNIIAITELVSDLENLKGDAFSGKEVIYQDIRDFSEDRLKYVDDVRSGAIKEPPRILCGIKEIDETMGTGFAPGILTLFCGEPGGYKSCMMLNVALNIWKKGYNVLHIPVEMAERRMYDRAWARESRINSEKIKDPTKLTDEERNRLEEAQKKWDEEEAKFYVMQHPDGTSVATIRRQIEKCLSIFQPKLVVVDYIDNLYVDKDRGDRHDLEISDMLQELRRMGQSMGFAVVSGAQLGRDSLRRIRRAGASRDQNVFTSEDIRGAHSFPMDADNVYAQIPNNQQPDSLLDIYVVKAREGKKIFPNGRLKATLLVTPEIGLIRSQEDLGIPEDEVLSQLIELEEENDTEDKEEVDNDDSLGFLG